MSSIPQKCILVFVPAPSARGGISNYYQALREFLPHNIIYLERGARNWPYRNSKFKETTRIFGDVFNLVRHLVKSNVRIVQTSTSLGWMSIYRDSLFMLISKFFSVKSVVFFRGWNPEVEEGLGFISRFLLKRVLLRSDVVIVLSNYVNERVLSLGRVGPTYIETTLVHDRLLENYSMNDVLDRRIDMKRVRLLYLGRIERSKGLFELLETFNILRSTFPQIQLTIAGDGLDEELLRSKAKELGLFNIQWLGFVSGQQKIDAFLNADVYVFPTYTEGMPNSVLEAMAFGLPTYTRPVGGIPDIFKDLVNGVLEESLEPMTMAERMQELISDEKRLIETGRRNYLQAKERFYASSVASRLLSIYSNV